MRRIPAAGCRILPSPSSGVSLTYRPGLDGRADTDHWLLTTDNGPLKRTLWRWSWRLSLLVSIAAALWATSVAVPEVGQPYQPPAAAEQKLWSFGFVGDTQLGEGVVERIFERLHDARVEFVLHLGDIVDNAEREDQWQFIVDQAARNELRLMPVVGNHDRLLDGHDRGEAGFTRYFPQIPGTFYHFEHEGLQFLMLNSERSFLPGTEQGQFLAAELAARRGPTIVCLHRPVFTCGDRDLANQFLRRVWLHGRLVGSETVLVLAGHHHYYDRSKPLDGITYVVSGGGGHKLYGAETPDERTAVFRAKVNHFGVVDVFSDHLGVRVLDLEGREIDRFGLGLQAPEAPRLPAPAEKATL